MRSLALIPALVVLTACAGDPTATPAARPQAVQVNDSQATVDAQQLATLEPTAVDCSNDARFVEDLTVPDRTRVAPGAVLDKRWAVLNSGECDWTAGYRLVRIDDGPIVAPQELALFPARSGENAVLQVAVEAPVTSGEHIASWQARAPDGSFFGDQVFVLIVVGP